VVAELKADLGKMQLELRMIKAEPSGLFTVGIGVQVVLGVGHYPERVGAVLFAEVAQRAQFAPREDVGAMNRFVGVGVGASG
jgi:hypothetical protein